MRSENRTLAREGASLAAARLAHSAIVISAKAAWTSRNVSTEPGRVQRGARGSRGRRDRGDPTGALSRTDRHQSPRSARAWSSKEPMGLAASLRRRVAYGVGVLALVTSFAAASAGKADAQVPSLSYCEIAAIAFNYNLQEYDWDGGATWAWWDEAAVYCGWWGRRLASRRHAEPRASRASRGHAGRPAGRRAPPPSGRPATSRPGPGA
jgi:hypothetical protein